MRPANDARSAAGDAAHAHSIRRFLRSLLSAAAILVISASAVTAAATKSPAAPSPVASYEILKNFTYWGGRPQSALLEASPGVFYGTASEFDEAKGSVFRVSPDGVGGFTLTALHTFSGPDGQTPMSALVTAGDSYLYGTTLQGGEFGYGTVFKLSLDGSDFAVLHSFTGGDDGQYPMGALLVDGDGFVGTTAGPDESDGGTVFRISADGTVATLHTFSGADGSHPWDALIRGTDDALYGTTRGGGTSDFGTIFRLSPDGLGGFEFTTVYEFTGSCLYPVGPLFQGASGDLYGTATVAAGGDYGGVFKVGIDGNGFAVLHAFSGFPDGEYPKGGVIQASDTYFYGTTTYGGKTDQGSVFRMTAAGEVTIIHSFDGDHGTNPVGGVIEGSDGKLYGTTDAGGADDGTVFRVSLDPPGFELMTSFRMATFPAAALVRGADGMLYGTTTGGDWYSDGTVFRMATDRSMFRILHSFNGSDGWLPAAALTPAGGAFYGTTAWGGTNDCGVVFRIQGDGTGFTVVHEFGGTDGCSPRPTLVRAADGSLYGTTSSQSGSDYGTIFKLTPTGEDWTFLTLHSFDGTNGAYPGDLTLGIDGKLYGTSTGGGSSQGNAGLGTIFRISTEGSDFALLHAFESGGANGSEPQALTEGEPGWFYGTTKAGGSAGYGTIFKIDKDGNGFARLYSFTWEEGIGPIGGLVRDAAGNFYGTTSEGGSSGFGMVFELAADETTFTILHTFGGAPDDGANPYAGLLLSDGYLYGTTMNGGWADYGTIFRIELLGGTTTPHVSASAGGPTTFCADSNVVLTATPSGGTGSYTGYQWYRDGTAIDGATSSTHTADASGSYTVTVTDSGTNTSAPSEPVGVTVNALPQPEITPDGPTTLLCGGSVTLTASDASSWLWSTTETTQSITVSDAGEYTVTVTDENGCTGGSPATTVTVDGPVAIVSGGGAACPKSPRTIEAELGGTGPWNLTWSDGYVQNGVTSSPATRDVSPRGETTYTVSFFSDANCAGTSEGSAVVTPAAAAKAVLKGSATICPGDPVTLTVELTGIGPWHLVWSDGHEQDSEENVAQYTVNPTEPTIYTITSVTDSGCGAGTARGTARIKMSRRCAP